MYSGQTRLQKTTGFIADILAVNRPLDLLERSEKYHVSSTFHFTSDQKTNYNCLFATTAPVPW